MIKNEFSNLKVIIISVTLAFVAALRVKTGTDWYQYVSLFQKISPDSVSDSLYTYIQSPGFVLFQVAIKQFTDDVRIFFFICSFVTTFNFLIALRKFQVNNLSALYLYYFLGFFVLSLNAVRQSIAVSLFFLAVSIRRESWIKFSLLIFLASCFHSSALFVGGFVLVMDKIKFKKKNVAVICISGISLSAFLQLNFVTRFVSVFDKRYEEHLNLEDGGIGTFLNLIFKMLIFVILAILAKDNQDKEFNIFLLFGCLFLYLATSSWIFARLEPYFSIFFTVTASRVLSKISNRPYSVPIFLAIAVFFGFYISFYNGVIPYLSIFNSTF